MKNNISLGKIKAGNTKKLTVTLAVAPNMDNRYQKLTGKVKWVFTAVGEDGSYNWPVSVILPPKTGDNSMVGMWLTLFGVSATGLGGIWGIRILAKKSREAKRKP